MITLTTSQENDLACNISYIQNGDKWIRVVWEDNFTGSWLQKSYWFSKECYFHIFMVYSKSKKDDFNYRKIS